MKHFMRLLRLSVVLVISTVSLSAQTTGKISGKVTFGDLQTVLSNATIRIVQLNRNVETDAAGNYQFTDLPPG